MALAESSAVTSSRGPVAFPVADADRTVVWLRGEHDVSTVAALSQTMARAIALDDGEVPVVLEQCPDRQSALDFAAVHELAVVVVAELDVLNLAE